MHKVLVAIGSITLSTLVAVASPAQAAEQTLTGQMDAMNYLAGAAWNCSTKVPAMHGQPARTDEATVTFEVVTGNVIHDHVTGANYVGDDYYGFDPTANAYWSTSADNMGAYGHASSTTGKTFTGTSSAGSATTNVSSTYTKVSPNFITIHNVLSGGGQDATIDTVCTR